MQEFINASIPHIPVGLTTIAKGRDSLSTNDAAYAQSVSPLTIRKHLCVHGHFHGIKPIKIGGRLFFKVVDLAKLVALGSPSPKN